MATQKSTQITNRDATPRVLNSGPLNGVARLHEVIGTLTTTTADTSGCKYLMVEVPSNARLSHLYFSAAAQTVGAYNFGIYRNTSDGGAVVSTTFLVTAVDCANAVAWTDLINESGIYTIDKHEKALWDAAGLTTDPKTTFDIVAIATTVLTLGALIGIKAQYAL